MKLGPVIGAIVLLPLFGILFFFTYMTLGFAGLPIVSDYTNGYYNFLNYGLPVIFVVIYAAVARLLFRQKGS